MKTNKQSQLIRKNNEIILEAFDNKNKNIDFSSATAQDQDNKPLLNIVNEDGKSKSLSAKIITDQIH